MNPNIIKNIRISFRNRVEYYVAKCEREIESKFVSNQKSCQHKIRQVHINLTNFFFLDYLINIKYPKALKIYEEKIYVNDYLIANDITRIILLFFPFLIKSHQIYLNSEHLSLDHFNSDKLVFRDSRNLDLNYKIQDFFKYYKELEEDNFVFHRREMLIYMDSFLYSYCKSLEGTNEKNSQSLENFLIFLRPELFFNYDNSTKELDID